MANQIHLNYDHSGTDYAERVKEKQAGRRAERAKEPEKDPEGKRSGKLFESQDKYICSERSGKKPTGLYRVERDENGDRKIFYDALKADHTNGKDGLSKKGRDSKEPEISEGSQKKPTEKCVADTDKVDREIEKLKKKKQHLEQQIRLASGDEKKIREMEKKLAQIENELRQKDNDTYRRRKLFPLLL